MSAPSDDGAPLDTEPTTPQRVSRFAGITARLAVWQQRGLALLERHRQRLLVDLGVRMYERDRDSAGSVVGSAIAFRLFLFFVPLLLLLVGVVGFLSALIDPGDISEAGISGRLATQIESALTQADSSRWVALAVGLIGLATTGRTLSKVLIQANCLAWRLPIQKKAPVRVIVAMVGLMFTVGVVTMVINRIRVDLGVGVASVSFLAACAVYIGAWGVLMVLLPRSTTDPGAVVPGAVLVGVTLTALQLVSQLYLPGRFDRASELYGAIGTTVVVLGWFFVLGRTVMVAFELNAVVYARLGSISQLIFALPLLRAVPRRWPRVAVFFQLAPDDPATADDDAPDVPRAAE